MWWLQAAQAWLPTIAVGVMAALAFVATLAQAPRAAKLPWIATVLVCGVLATAASAWQQSRENDLDRGDFGFHFGRDRRAIFASRPDNVFLLKVSYWLSP